jgi:hypothetical protein
MIGWRRTHQSSSRFEELSGARFEEKKNSSEFFDNEMLQHKHARAK